MKYSTIPSILPLMLLPLIENPELATLGVFRFSADIILFNRKKMLQG